MNENETPRHNIENDAPNAASPHHNAPDKSVPVADAPRAESVATHLEAAASAAVAQGDDKMPHAGSDALHANASSANAADANASSADLSDGEGSVTPTAPNTKAVASTRGARAGALSGALSKIPARVLTALLGIPLVLFIVWQGGALLTGVTVFLALVAMRELIVAARRNKTPLVIEWCYFLLLFVMVSLWHTMPLWREIQLSSVAVSTPPVASLLHLAWPLLALLLVPLWLLSWAVFRYQKNRVTLSSVALSTLAVNYVALFAFLPMLREAPNGLSLFVLLLAGVWTGDTAAYYAGRALGKRRLTALSPGKTREGVLAGAFATLLMCLVLAGALQMEWMHGLAIGFLIAVLAPLGDLVESLWKRELGTKDFGAMLPGHGGVLDRCDSLLLAAPAVFLYALWQGL